MVKASNADWPELVAAAVDGSSCCILTGVNTHAVAVMPSNSVFVASCMEGLLWLPPLSAAASCRCHNMSQPVSLVLMRTVPQFGMMIQHPATEIIQDDELCCFQRALRSFIVLNSKVSSNTSSNNNQLTAACCCQCDRRHFACGPASCSFFLVCWMSGMSVIDAVSRYSDWMTALTAAAVAASTAIAALSLDASSLLLPWLLSYNTSNA